MLEIGQVIPINFKGRSFNAIIIDPDGLGPDKPTIGVGCRGMSRHLNISHTNLMRRVVQIEGSKVLKLPSGKTFRVVQITGNDGNEYTAIEVSDWVQIAADWLKKPGKLRTAAKNGIIDFLAWYAAEGLYAEAYTFLKQTYSREDNELVQQWLVAREAGKPPRKEWAYTIADQGGESPFKYGKWTNYIYRGLFGMDAAEMKQVWTEPVSGSKAVARNYIPESEGLEMVAHCERLIPILGFDDLEQAHDEAIRLTQMKFRQSRRQEDLVD